jgi:ParB family chromosome partitioning protein
MDKPKRGLGSLIPPGQWEIPPETRTEVEISQIATNPYQPRLSLNREQLQEMVDSIRMHGVIQPLLIRKSSQPDGQYELIAGERRLQAAKAAGLTHVPVVFRDCTDRQMLELALVENIQREDINAIDRATAYQKLRDNFNLDQEAIGAAVGKSRTTIANSLRLLNLPAQVQASISEGKLSEGHGRALMPLENPELIARAARQVIKRGLSVRSTESLVKRLSQHRISFAPQTEPPKDPNLADLESRLSIQLGTKVRINPGKNEKANGYLIVEFYGLDDLNRISGAILGE